MIEHPLSRCDLVLDLLMDGNPRSTNEISQALGVEFRLVANTISSLRTRGKIERKGLGFRRSKARLSPMAVILWGVKVAS